MCQEQLSVCVFLGNCPATSILNSLDTSGDSSNKQHPLSFCGRGAAERLAGSQAPTLAVPTCLACDHGVANCGVLDPMRGGLSRQGVGSGVYRIGRVSCHALARTASD